MMFDLKTVIAGAMGLSTIVAGGTWAVNQRSNESLRETISSYEKSKDWKLPEAIEEVNKAAIGLGGLAKRINDATQLRDECKRLEEANTAKSSIIAKQEKDIADLKRQVARFQPLYKDLKNSPLKLNDSLQLYDGKLSIGLSSVYDGRAVLTINNSTTFLNVGGSSETKDRDLLFSITLVSVDPKGGTISLTTALQP